MQLCQNIFRANLCHCNSDIKRVLQWTCVPGRQSEKYWSPTTDLQVPQTHNSREQGPSWKASRSSASQEMPPHFMKPKGSLPHPWKPITCPYPELDQPSLWPHLTLKGPLYYYTLTYAQLFRVVSLPQVSSPKPCTNLAYLPYVLHASLSQASLFDHPNNIWCGVDIIKLLIM